MSEEEIKVEILELEGKQYKRVFENGDEFWCIRTIAQHCEVSYENIRKHLRNKSQIFHPFIRSYNLKLEKSKGRPQLFLKVPDGLDQLRLYVRKLKNNPEMNKIMSFISSMRKGDIVAAKKEDIEKLKLAHAKTSHLVLGQDITYIVKELQEIKEFIKQVQMNGIPALPDHTFHKDIMDLDRKKIISWLLDNLSKEWGVPFYQIWWEFSAALGIENYGKQPKEMFPDMIEFFFLKDKKLVVRACNWYSSGPHPKEEIREIFLALFEFDKQKKLIDEDVGVIT